MGERLLCKQEVIGSIPFTSTISRKAAYGAPTAVTELPREGVVPHRGWPLKTIVEVPDCRRLRPETVFFDR